MKKLMVWIGVLAVALGMRASAQDATQTWQGTLHVGKDLRCEVRITKVNGALQGRFYSIDQGSMSFGTTTLSLDNSELKFTIVGIDASYDGKLSADGKSAVGTWTQGGQGHPLTLEHVNADAAWEIPKPTAALSPMDPKIVPGYEVATVKPSKPDEQGEGITLRGRHLVTINTSAETLITFAYNLHPKQVVGAPDWVATVHYDLDVLPDAVGLPNLAQGRELLRKLLADRFGLKFHDDKKELSVYVLSVAKSGPKLTKSGSDPNSPPGIGFRGPGKMMVRNSTMEEFAGAMQMGVMDRPVVDQTGLKDRYDFQLNWTPDESQFGGRVPPPSSDNGAANADALPSLYTAIGEQLGLKLEATKAPAKVFVIDHIDKPSAN